MTNIIQERVSEIVDEYVSIKSKEDILIKSLKGENITRNLIIGLYRQRCGIKLLKQHLKAIEDFNKFVDNNPTFNF